MGIPKQTLRIKDPGQGSSSPASMRPLIIGQASSGDYAIHSLSQPSDVVDTYESGALPELASFILQNGGGPVLTLRTQTSVTGSISTVTKTAVGTSTGTVTVAGTVRDSRKCRALITSTGTVGTAMFQYWLDGRTLNSAPILVPSGGTYTIPGTELTLTFVPGAGSTYFEAGDKHDFTTTGPSVNATDLSSAFTTILASPLKWRFGVLASRPASAAAGATLMAALATQIASLESAYKYRRFVIDAGPHASSSDDTAIATAYASQFNARIMVCAGSADLASAMSFQGWAYPTKSIAMLAACHATGPASLGLGIPCTDLKRVRSGPLPGYATNADGTPAISHDEFRSETLDALGFTTTRTYPDSSAVYLTEGRLKAASGSDFQYWHLGLLMDIACEIAVAEQATLTGESVRTRADGSNAIDERDAGSIETQINSALGIQLLAKPRANGQRGYVQDVRYTIDREADISDGYLTAMLEIVAFVYIKGVELTVSLVHQIKAPTA
jgi:hypothetical protein